MTNPPPPANSVEDAFRPAFEEISRRSTVAKELEVSETTYFTPQGGPFNLPFHISGQDFFLITMGTAVLAPRPKDTSRPALRVYGAFGTKEEAIEHSDIVKEMDPYASLVIVPRDEWVLMPQTEEARDDPGVNTARRDRILAEHRDRRLVSEDNFKERVQTHEETIPASMNEVAEEDDDVLEAEALVYKPPKRLRTGAEVRGQSVVVFCAVTHEFGECVLKFLGCFESTDEANQWARNVATREIVHDDVLVSPCCEWIYPNASDRKATHNYRIDELQRIMDAAERNPVAVKNYKEWKREQDRLQEEQTRLRQNDGPSSMIVDKTDGSVE